MSAEKKIIAVCGATGTQGGSVVRDLLADGTFAVRGLTRNPDGAAAQALKKQGVEVVKADLEDTASLTAAFQGAYGVFGITVWTLFFAKNFDQAATEAHETQHGKNLVDAAKAAGVKHFVWSTLDAPPTVHVYHFYSKANVNPYLKDSGIPYTLLYTSFYYDNMTLDGFNMLVKNDDGSFTVDIAAPVDTRIHAFAGSDVGRWVVPILKDTPKYNGKDVHAVAEFITPKEWVEIMERVTGKKVQLKSTITKEQFFTDEFHNATGDELWLNYRGWVDEEIKRDFDNSNAVGKDPITLEKFLKTNKKVRAFMGLD